MSAEPKKWAVGKGGIWFGECQSRVSKQRTELWGGGWGVVNQRQYLHDLYTEPSLTLVTIIWYHKGCVCVCVCVCVCMLSHVQLFATPWPAAYPWNFPGKDTRVGCHFLLQGIFPTQGLNLHLLCVLHWQVDSLLLVPPVKPIIKNKFLIFLNVPL